MVLSWVYLICLLFWWIMCVFPKTGVAQNSPTNNLPLYPRNNVQAFSNLVFPGAPCIEHLPTFFKTCSGLWGPIRRSTYSIDHEFHRVTWRKTLISVTNPGSGICRALEGEFWTKWSLSSFSTSIIAEKRISMYNSISYLYTIYIMIIVVAWSIWVWEISGRRISQSAEIPRERMALCTSDWAVLVVWVISGWNNYSVIQGY